MGQEARHYFSIQMRELPNIIGLLACLACSGMLSGWTAVVVALKEITLEEIEANLQKLGLNASKLDFFEVVKNGSTLMAAAVICGNALVNVAITHLWDNTLPSDWGLAGALFAATSIVIVGELLPNILVIRDPIAFSARTIMFAKLVRVVLFVPAWITDKTANLLSGGEETRQLSPQEALFEIRALVREKAISLVSTILRLPVTIWICFSYQ